MKNIIKCWLGIDELEKSVATLLLKDLKNMIDCILTENGFTKEYEDELLKDEKSNLKKKRYSSFAEAHKKFNKVTKKHVRKSK